MVVWGLYKIENSNLLSSNFSISTWIKTSTTGKVQGIVSQSPASSTLRNEHFLFVDIDNKLNFNTIRLPINGLQSDIQRFSQLQIGPILQ